MNEKWDRRFLSLAREVSGWSKDPSTKVGAVIVRPNKTIASVGFNGFPKNAPDNFELYADREFKYRRIIHGEMNAILFARELLAGYTLYTYPFFTCERCMVHVIQSGIVRVVSLYYEDKETQARWDESLRAATLCAEQAGITWHIYSPNFLKQKRTEQ